jgi:N-acetylglucosaminyl-diphospho-decaprenol L-rhamnosyltransferase
MAGKHSLRRLPDAALRIDPALSADRRHRASANGVSDDGLDIGIVAYRSRRLLRDCLISLREHAPKRPTHVIVVDNGSRDGTVEMLREFPDVELIEAGRNLGFAAATNLAIGRGSGRYFLALNPDTRVPAGVLDDLLRLMDKRPEIGICGCRLEREDGTFDHAAKRAFPTPVGALAHFTRIGRTDGAPAALAQYRAPNVDKGPVDAVSGAFMLIRRRALDDVGRFDEGYWLYMEDLDLCYRFAEADWVTWYEPSVVVTHVKGGTSGRNRTLRVNGAFHYGMYRFYRLHYADRRWKLFNLAVYTAIAAKFVCSAARSAFNRHVRRDCR